MCQTCDFKCVSMQNPTFKSSNFVKIQGRKSSNFVRNHDVKSSNFVKIQGRKSSNSVNYMYLLDRYLFVNAKYLHRKAYSKLLEWKETMRGSTAIRLDGARRVGKSTLVKEFAKNEYKSCLYIDFSIADKQIRDIIVSNARDLDLLFNKLSRAYDVTLYRRKSLVVFDEIQTFPFARQMIKHFVEDGRYDYIETGSLISIQSNIQNILIPSEEQQMYLHPLDFEEFLWAMGVEDLAEYLKDCYNNNVPVGGAVHSRAMDWFRQYMLVGGMPQVVSEYSRSKDFHRADIFKKEILYIYRADITRFAKGYEKKVEAIFDDVPSELSKKNKRFKITSLGEGARMRDYDSSFMWLEDGMITSSCYNASDPSSAGLSMYLERPVMKCYLNDTGLLVTHAMPDKNDMDNVFYRDILLDKLGVNEGMFTENIVAQMLRASGNRLFYYYRSDAENAENNMEVDFLVRIGRKICPIEVKSSSSDSISSLKKFHKKFPNTGQPIILYSGDVNTKDGILYLPLYMAMFL